METIENPVTMVPYEGEDLPPVDGDEDPWAEAYIDGIED